MIEKMYVYSTEFLKAFAEFILTPPFNIFLGLGVLMFATGVFVGLLRCR